jgi:POT family proton-dependent oligopeptide transporter
MLSVRQPAGLYTLFFTEMWERFSYYGMRALLVLYLVNALDYPREQALSVYAVYTALVYVTPIVGGYLADKWLGARLAILVGAIVMAMGHFAMAVPAFLHLALGLLIVGNGFFKPNISTLVGALYARDDPRRDGGFTLFYMGINLGAFLSPLVCGTLGERIGWHYGFAAAGVGMLAALAVFVSGQQRLGGAGFGPRHLGRSLLPRDWITVVVTSLACLGLVSAGVALYPRVSSWWHALHGTQQTGLGLALVVGALLAPRLRARFAAHGGNYTPLTRADVHRLLALAILAFFVIFFWLGFEQAGGTMNLFADQLTDRVVGSWEIPASYFQSVNPLAIIVLAPLFSLLWPRWDRSRYALPTPAKMAAGLLLLAVAFVVLAIGHTRAETLGKVGPAWLVMVYVLQTVGELFLSPIGLSLVTRLAPPRLVAVSMGFWFMAMGAANYLAGTLEALLQGSGIPLYWFLVGSSMAAGVLLLLLTPLLRRLMHGIS